ncbi:MAG: hypothetical protein ACI8RC_002300, partial [Ilumatobacter sp.]
HQSPLCHLDVTAVSPASGVAACRSANASSP